MFAALSTFSAGYALGGARAPVCSAPRPAVAAQMSMPPPGKREDMMQGKPEDIRMIATPQAKMEQIVGASKVGGEADDWLAPVTASWAPPIPWEVHKFGGASLATPELYTECAELMVSESQKALERAGSCAPTMVIVSAKGGVTDKLISVVNAALTSMEESARLLRVVADEQVEVVKAIADAATAADVEARIRADEEDILMVVRAVSLIKTVPATTMELVTGYGEVWSAMTMHAYLASKGVPSAWLDARQVLVVESTGSEGLGTKGSSNVMGVDPVWAVTAERLGAWWADEAQAPLREADFATTAPIVVVTGFVASLSSGTPTTLKRSGSDYSATIFARLMSASSITMWKNVNGVYTADPRRVPEAFPITSLKFDEAIELAYFGAQVLHPSAMSPCIEGRIPIFVRNIFNPSHPGTVIEGRACSLTTSADSYHEELTQVREEKKLGRASCRIPLGDNDSPIRGITSVDHVALVTLEGTGLMNVPDVSHRLFGSLLAASVPVVMVTQASADSSVCVVVAESDARATEAFLAEAFETELRKGGLASVSVEHGLSVVAIVGEGMAFRPGVGATFTQSMANAGVNIRAIAQGSSERQISIVVDQEDCTRALRAAHAALALSNSQLSVGVIGASGQVGNALLEQLRSTGLACRAGVAPSKRPAALEELRLDIKVTALCDKGTMALSYDGVCPEGSELAADSERGEAADLEKLTRFINEDYNGNRVLIDCTASEEVSQYYARWLEAGVHVITANKKVGSGPYDKYAACVAASKTKAQWLYETTGPGSGLPVLSTIKDMRQSGDSIAMVEGVFSGTLSYLLHQVAAGMPFSAALAEAAAHGFCEPDPRDDITFLDVRRKTVVIARELGMGIEMSDIDCSSLLPPGLADWTPEEGEGAPPVAAQLAEALQPYDAALAERVAAAAKEGKVLTPVARVDLAAGEATVGLEELPLGSRLTRSAGNDNIIAVHSARYAAQPLVIQGPGAGAQITASGLFADLLSISRSVVEWTIPSM